MRRTERIRATALAFCFGAAETVSVIRIQEIIAIARGAARFRGCARGAAKGTRRLVRSTDLKDGSFAIMAISYKLCSCCVQFEHEEGFFRGSEEFDRYS